jgi:hypothetical protein
MRKVMMVALAGFVVMALCVGCSSSKMTSASNEPAWVAKGVYAFPDEVGKAFYGVGIAEGKMIPGIQLRRTAAQERGRQEIARQISVVVQGVFKDYQEAAFSDKMDKGSMDSLVSNTARSICDQSLVGSEMREIWVDRTADNGGDYYALMRLSFDTVAKQLKDKMAEVEKGRLKVDAAKAHEDLDKIIDKNRASAVPAK